MSNEFDPKTILLTKNEITDIAMNDDLIIGGYGEAIAIAQLLRAAEWFWSLHDSGEGEGWLMKDAAKALGKAAGDES